MTATRDYDLVVFGATSFAGQILTHYLWQHYGDSGELRWAIAGRSQSRLQQLRESLGAAASEIKLIVADADDEQDLRAMCELGRVIISTVGPYALYGETLVKVCAETGTDYCDLCGEVQWISRMVRSYQASAQASGARIVNCCGFDSLPSDMGVWFLQQQALKAWGKPCQQVKMRVAAFKGGISGGTVASMMNLAKEAAGDTELRRELTDPYSLCPPDHSFSQRQADLKTARYDSDFKAWIAPFVMSSINTRVVHRTNALRNNAYGSDFLYDEAMLTGRGLKGSATAMAIAGGSAMMMLGAATAPTRRLLNYAVPKPGEGPSPKQQLNGFYELDFLGISDTGDTLKVQVRGDRDPGYGSTAKMLAQAGACLAQDISRKTQAGGFWTPASIYDQRLIDRLQRDAGMVFELQ
jgi:short subunit dehydrogenase-like uncharacterized protein